MKNSILVILLFTVAGFSKLNAQIVNNSFENWYLDTFAIDSGQYGSLPGDTVVFNEPVGWTSSNYLSDLDSLGHVALVTQSGNAYVGQFAIKMVTDSIHVPQGLLHSSIPISQLIIPGFAVNGIFNLGTGTFTSASVINPGTIVGAGQPFTQRLASISGYYNYTPMFNPLTGSNDTCIVWAVLRNGSNIIANAIFKSTDSTQGYLPFTANFQYVGCDEPDTLVVFLASSSPNVYTFIPALGENTIPVGSKLLIDDLTYDTLAANYVFAPFAVNDNYIVYANSTDTLNVLGNDTDCSSPLTVSIVTGPDHGTAVVLGNNTIQYTPTTSFLGYDSIYYKDTNNSSGTAQALAQIYVTQNSGIFQVPQLALNLHPVPVNNELNIQFENPGKCSGKVYDVVGNLVISTELNNNNNLINTQYLQNGMYVVEILNEQNAVIGSGRFVVVK